MIQPTMKKPFIIAEAAQGYEGSFDIARLLVQGAKLACADAIKFQLVIADELATPDYLHYKLFQSLSLEVHEWLEITRLAKDAGLQLYFDVFGMESLALAKSFAADGVKIHSTDFFNHELVSCAMDAFQTVYIGIGGVTRDEFEAFLRFHQISHRNGITFLYGFQAEPTPSSQNHLGRLQQMILQYPELTFGFMDHSDRDSIEAYCLAPCAMYCGATVIEKHLTIEPSLTLEDSISALSPAQFKQFVKACEASSEAFGCSDWIPSELETSYRSKISKVVVATKPIQKGCVLSKDNVALKRPGSLPSSGAILSLSEALGKATICDLDIHQPVLSSHLL